MLFGFQGEADVYSKLLQPVNQVLGEATDWINSPLPPYKKGLTFPQCSLRMKNFSEVRLQEVQTLNMWTCVVCFYFY